MILTLLLLTLVVPVSLANGQNVSTAHNALSALYSDTNGYQWADNTGWNINTVPASMGEFNQWFGLVVINDTLRAIELRDNRLTGPIPPELGNLSELEGLNLNDNRLVGSIPPELGNLSELEGLGLMNNRLVGSIPIELGNLLEMQQLGLGENQLTGPIPPELGNLSELIAITLNNNQLTGPIPPELGNLSELIAITLNNNQLTGPIPRSFLQLRGLLLFHFDNNAGLCAPPDDAFQAWLRRIPNLEAGPICPPSVSVEKESVLPAEFAVQGNYPNPLRTATRLRLDLPWDARVSVSIFDVTGRRVYKKTTTYLPAGYGREISLRELGRLPSGAYLYRLMVDTPAGRSLHTGRIVRVR